MSVSIPSASVSVTIVKISVTVDVFPHAITTTMSSISVLPDTWSSTTANSSPESTSLAAIKSTPGSQTPTSNWTAVQSCFQAHFDPGCGGMLQHVMDCYENQAPWVDPLNTTQSTAFQACLCQTSPSVRFSTNSVLWHDFTSCAFCLFGWVPINFYELLPEMQRIEEFCSSQTPVRLVLMKASSIGCIVLWLTVHDFQFGYVFLPNLLDWLGSLYKGTTLAKPPLTGSITLITDMAPLCTPVPPLANLAYGASAPPDGILGALVPALTTFTTLQSNKLATITSLITWLPTATSEFTMASVESSAASVASRELASALYSWANASKTSGGHGGPIMERCSGLDRASADAIYCFPFTRALLVSVVAIGVVVVLQT